jgi:GntR family transcriptional regulator, histidine utilization repressor
MLPRYEQVKRLVLSEIASRGEGDAHLLPSENELVRRLGISRMTINRALRELAAEGIVTRVRGVGTFSAGPKSELSAIDVQNIADEIRGRGNRYDCRIELLRAEEAGSDVASDLSVPVGSRVFHSIIVHRENGVAIQVEDRFVNPGAAPNFLEVDFKEITPHLYLSQVAPLTDAEHFIEAVLPSGRDCKLLGLRAGEPCLLVRRRTWSGPVLCTRARLLHPGTRYRISSYFSRPTNGSSAHSARRR